MDLSARPGVLEEPGWTVATDLVTDDDLLDDVIGRIGRAYGLENRAFAGTFLLRDVLWRVLSPAAAAFLAEGRLPDLRAENVAISLGEDGFIERVAYLGSRFLALPDDPEAGHPHAVVVSVEDLPDTGVRIPVSETYLAALIPALKGLGVRRGTRTLWRAAADVCAEAFIYVGREMDLEKEGVGLARRLLAGPPPLSASLGYRVLEYPGGSEATRVRSTCCLYYKTGRGTCFTCPRKTDEERIRQLTSVMDKVREGEQG